MKNHAPSRTKEHLSITIIIITIIMIIVFEKRIFGLTKDHLVWRKK